MGFISLSTHSTSNKDCTVNVLKEEYHIEIFNKLEKVKDEIKPNDFRFYNISHFPLLAKFTFENSSTCTKCSENIGLINDIVDSLPESLSINSSERRKFEKRKTDLETHLKKSHNMRFPGHYTSLFSFVFVIVSILISILINLFLKKAILNDITLIAASVGIISGILLGKNFDHRIFKKNLQL